MIIAIILCLVARRACGVVAIVVLLAFARPAHGGPIGTSPPSFGTPPIGSSPFGAPQSGIMAVPPSGTPHPSVARIIVAEKGAQSLGSGTLVDARENCGLVITNWHVVRDAAGDIQVVFPGGFSSLGRVMKVDQDWDLAALAIWRPTNIQPVSISSRAPQLGEPLTIAGYGSGKYRAATGRCSQYVSPGKNFPFEMVELSAEARQGDSGGPIFNAQGEMAGVLFGASRGTTSGSYGGRVRWFLASLVPDLGQPGASDNPHAMLAANSSKPGLTLGANNPVTTQNAAPNLPAAPHSTAVALSPPGTELVKPKPKQDATLVPVPFASAARESSSRDAQANEQDPGERRLLPTGLGGYGYNSLPDREVAAPSLGSQITRGLSSSDNGANSTDGTANMLRSLFGDNVFDQVKSGLALVGLLAVALRLLRSSGS